jgi:hypothetical protein
MNGIFSIQDAMDKRAPLMLPEHLMPSFYGIRWGMSFSSVAEILGEAAVLKKPNYYTVVKKSIAGEQVNVTLYFQDDDLAEIHADLCVSQPFWERDEHTVRLQEELLVTLEKYYSYLVSYYEGILGASTFSGSWQSPEFPQDESAALLTMWDASEGIFRIEFTQPDKELPIFVRLSTRPLRNNEPNHIPL